MTGITSRPNLQNLNKSSEKEEFWSDNKSAQMTMKRISDLKDEINLWEDINNSISDIS